MAMGIQKKLFQRLKVGAQYRRESYNYLNDMNFWYGYAQTLAEVLDLSNHYSA